MHHLATLVLLLVPVSAQQIIAASSGLPNPSRVFDFGANVLPNFTTVTTQFAGLTIDDAAYFTTGVSNNLVGGFLTRDNGVPPDTLRVQFQTPITDLAFVYHQVGTQGPSTIRVLYLGQPVDSFTGTWNQYQTNNWFGFQGQLMDELQIDYRIDFNVDTLQVVEQSVGRCLFANGTGVNPPDFTCASNPVLGTTWQGLVAGGPNTVLTFLLYAPVGLAAPVPLFGGELLLPANPAPVAFAGLGSYSMAIPNAPGWIGTTLAFQGFRVEVLGATTTLVPLNAQTLLLGL